METSCGVVLVNLGTVLLLQYPQGHWDLPKGHVEPTDSDYFETAERELKEETGISEFEFMDGFEYRTEYEFSYKGKVRNKQVYWHPLKEFQSHFLKNIVTICGSIGFKR